MRFFASVSLLALIATAGAALAGCQPGEGRPLAPNPEADVQLARLLSVSPGVSEQAALDSLAGRGATLKYDWQSSRDYRGRDRKTFVGGAVLDQPVARWDVDFRDDRLERVVVRSAVPGGYAKLKEALVQAMRHPGALHADGTLAWQTARYDVALRGDAERSALSVRLRDSATESAVDA